jgi:hypothetical protein
LCENNGAYSDEESGEKDKDAKTEDDSSNLITIGIISALAIGAITYGILKLRQH